MSKKILSLALAVVMLMSIFAFSVNAEFKTDDTVFPGTNQGGYRVVTNAYVGMPANSEVVAKVYLLRPDYKDTLQSECNVVIAYTDGFQLDTETPGTKTCFDARTFGASYIDYLKGEDNLVNNLPAFTTSVISKLAAADKAYGWDTAILVQGLVDTSVTTAKKGFPYDPYCEFFSLKFTTTRELTEDDSIGIPTHTLGSTSTFKTTNGTTYTNYKAASIINSEGVAKVDYVEVNDTTTAKIRINAQDSTKVDIGCTGTVLDASFKKLCPNGLTWYKDKGADISNEVKAVAVQFRLNGTIVAGTTNTIYVDDAGNFKFRAATTGIPADGLDDLLEVRMAMDVNGTAYYSNWMVIDADTVHDNAVANNSGFAGIK